MGSSLNCICDSLPRRYQMLPRDSPTYRASRLVQTLAASCSAAYNSRWLVSNILPISLRILWLTSPMLLCPYLTVSPRLTSKRSPVSFFPQVYQLLPVRTRDNLSHGLKGESRFLPTGCSLCPWSTLFVDEKYLYICPVFLA